MKIVFNPDLDFQAEAVSFIVDLFDGQETCQTNFTVCTLETTAHVSLYDSDQGKGTSE